MVRYETPILLFVGVVVLSLAAMFSEQASPEMMLLPPTGMLARAVPSTLHQTVILTGIDLNDYLGSDISVLTAKHLSSLASGRIQTQRGSTTYNQVLRLQQSLNPSFNGGQLVYTKNKEGEVSDFVRFASNQPLFEYELEFNPGLQGELIDGKSEDIEGKALLLLGKPAAITRVEASGTRILLRFFSGAGDIEFVDSDVTDNTFEDGVEVNGNRVEAQVRIKGSVSGTRVNIYSIQYRPEARSKLSGDIYVAPLRGVRGYLHDPAALLSSSFDLIYGGMSAGQRRGVTSTTRRAPISGNVIELRPSGGDEYRLLFTNNRGRFYSVPLYRLDGSSVEFGDDSHDLIVSEGSSSSDFNIDEGDYFIVSSGTQTSSDTYVLRLDAVDSNRVIVSDLTGGSVEAAVLTDGTGTLPIGGTHYTFVADPTTENIVVDQNNDGSYTGGSVRVVVAGGAQLQLSTSSVIVRVPKKLFKDDAPDSDETTTVTVTTSGGDLDLELPSQDNLTMQKGRGSDVRSGMTLYGVLFEHNDEVTPATLKMTIPHGQVGASVSVREYPGTTGQSRGWIVITTERERFVRE